MSKGNLFLGQGRGSVGDVTFYRANGQQLARSRNRSPRNPRTDAQLYQRAIAATIAQAYKAGKKIFDHSFEGYSVPGGNQRRFISLNMRKLRQSLENFLIGGASANDTRVVSPGAVYPTPNSYIVSEGTLLQSLFQVNNVASLSATLPAPDNGQKLGEYCSANGIIAGEIYTLVAFAVVDEYDVDDMISPQTRFDYLRLIVKQSAMESVTLMSAATYGDLFEIESSGVAFPASHLLTEPIAVDEMVVGGGENGSMGVIRSNENSGLRSDCVMQVYNANYGVQFQNLLDAWNPDSSLVPSKLILEGGGFPE